MSLKTHLFTTLALLACGGALPAVAQDYCTDRPNCDGSQTLMLLAPEERMDCAIYKCLTVQQRAYYPKAVEVDKLSLRNAVLAKPITCPKRKTLLSLQDIVSKPEHWRCLTAAEQAEIKAQGYTPTAEATGDLPPDCEYNFRAVKLNDANVLGGWQCVSVIQYNSLKARGKIVTD